MHKIYNRTFTARGEGTVAFKLLDFSNTKSTGWYFQVDVVSERENMPHDCIIGTDIMNEMGVVINFEDKSIRWGESEIPMCEYSEHPSNVHQAHAALSLIEEQDEYMDECPLLKRAEERLASIVDADYSKVDIEDKCRELNLSDALRKKLACTLKKFLNYSVGVYVNWRRSHQLN